MHVLLTNDDGIDAPGLQALFQSVASMIQRDDQITVVAPDRGRSECGHSVTTGRTLVCKEVDAGWFSLDGTPVDCVRAARAAIASDVDAVISGINAGANLGIDLLVSGTFAAAREAAVQGLPALAVSHYRRPEIPKTWDHCTDWLSETMAEFLDEVRAQNAIDRDPILWNVNLPAIEPSAVIPRRVECRVDHHPMERTGMLVRLTGDTTAYEVPMQSEFHGRPRGEGNDVERCFGGDITISRLSPRVV